MRKLASPSLANLSRRADTSSSRPPVWLAHLLLSWLPSGFGLPGRSRRHLTAFRAFFTTIFTEQGLFFTCVLYPVDILDWVIVPIDFGDVRVALVRRGMLPIEEELDHD